MNNRKKKLGLTFKAVGTHPHAWGPGKIHLQFWNKEYRQWALWCRPSDVGAFSGYHTHEMDLWKEPTCKNCLTKWNRMK